MSQENNLKKIRIIHIEHCSHSYFLKNPNDNPDGIIKGSWGTQVVREIKRYYPDIEIECWFPEKKDKIEREFYHWNVKLRIFPTTFSPKYGLDFSLPMIKALKGEVKKCKKDGKKLIIHLHEYHNFHGLAFSFLFKNEKLIAQHHGGSWPLKHLKQTKKYLLFFPFFIFGQFLEQKLLKNIKIFYALSAEEINYLNKISPRSKIKFQSMGILKDYFKKINRSYARRKLNISLDKKMIIFIGRVNKEKGIKYLLNAMKCLKWVDLKIIGYLQQVDYFKRYKEKNHLNNVEFLGGVFGRKKLLFLSAADALILPSLKEGAPVVIMEAVAKNLPIVATDIGGVTLMIKDKREGIIIKKKDSKEIVKGIKEILTWKNKNIKKYAEKYKWKSIIESTIKDYKNL